MVAGALVAAASPASAVGFTLTYSGWLNGSGGYSTTQNTVAAHGTDYATVDTSTGGLTFTNTFPPIGNIAPGTATTQTFINPGDSLYVTGGQPTHLAAPTAFTLSGHFDTNTTNQVAALNRPGFAAYQMSNVQITILGVTYTMAPGQDLAAAIFDRTSGFGPPPGNHYAIGMLHNGTRDTGFGVSEFVSASTDFTAATLTDTTMLAYDGSGFGNRIKSFIQGETAGVDNIALIAPDSTPYTLGTYFAYQPGLYDTAGNLMTFSAQLVPEPASMAVLGLGLAGLGALRRRRTA